jgi:glycine/D-amino acid oxidase-like deaminating enzyme/nitrite reductase/ring-hydroxylating ferredoxin subunit
MLIIWFFFINTILSTYIPMKSQHTHNPEDFSSEVTSGSNEPFWFSKQNLALSFDKLTKDASTDVLVIGGGISGLTTAYCLAKKGRKVILVEDGHLGSGETGRTTAHITCALDDRYFEIEKTFCTKTSELAANSHMAAIEFIEHTVRLNNINCNFKRVDGYLFLHPEDKAETLEKEYEATKRAGLITHMLSKVPHIHAERGNHCIQFSNQGQFHILLYLEGLAKAFTDLGGEIYTDTRAENISSKGAKANGFDIKANHIVVATNTPINDWVTMHTKQWPFRTYVIGARVPKGKIPYALWWDTGNPNDKSFSQPYHYARLEEFDKKYDMLIVGGEDHRTGQDQDWKHDEKARYDRLKKWSKKHFPEMESIEFKWSGQVMEPLDCLAYIGKNPGDENIYIITGDSGNGMTHGTLGGMIITDLITGADNPWAEIYSPSRITLGVTGEYLSEVGNMAAQYADWFEKDDIENTDDLKPGEGAIVSNGFKKMAVYRDENNELHGCSGVCPHLGGVLHWNKEEKTFDCPVHGSRFNWDGKLLNGPAINDLKPVI